MARTIFHDLDLNIFPTGILEYSCPIGLSVEYSQGRCILLCWSITIDILLFTCTGSENFGTEINVFEFKTPGAFENICNCVDADLTWAEGPSFVPSLGLAPVLFCA